MICNHEAQHLVGSSDGILCKKCGRKFVSFEEIENDLKGSNLTANTEDTDVAEENIKEEKKTAVLVTHDLQEAISMSDRIFVLTKRPAKIKAIHTTKFDKSLTPFEKRQTIEAEKLFNTLWEEIQDEQT